MARMILTYDIHRGPARELAIALCPRHAEARKVLGWTLIEERAPLAPRPSCNDCWDAERTSTVLDRVIEAADAEALAAEPRPVPILPGQRKLFG